VTFLAFIIALPLVISLWILESVVLMCLWGWFIVPLGVRSITVPWAFGLALVSAVLTHQDVDHDDDKAGSGFAMAVARPAVAWLLGWAVHSWLM
jgi:hypothetical protein